jgi:hypothetical protein
MERWGRVQARTAARRGRSEPPEEVRQVEKCDIRDERWRQRLEEATEMAIEPLEYGSLSGAVAGTAAAFRATTDLDPAGGRATSCFRQPARAVSTRGRSASLMVSLCHACSWTLCNLRQIARSSPCSNGIAALGKAIGRFQSYRSTLRTPRLRRPDFSPCWKPRIGSPTQCFEGRWMEETHGQTD